MPDMADLPAGPVFSGAAGSSAEVVGGAHIPRPSQICRFLPSSVGELSEAVQIGSCCSPWLLRSVPQPAFQSHLRPGHTCVTFCSRLLLKFQPLRPVCGSAGFQREHPSLRSRGVRPGLLFLGETPGKEILLALMPSSGHI